MPIVRGKIFRCDLWSSALRYRNPCRPAGPAARNIRLVRVLIADDSVVSRHLLEATLRKWGYEVVSASDGATAWETLQKEDAPALAILDWMMPGMTGLDVCRLVRQMNRERYTYVLLLTSRSQKEDLIEGMEAGADDYIIKPFDQHELKVRLRAGTRIIELQSELLAAREALREQATRDSLTRLWNRSSILDILQRELSRSLREKRPLGLLLVDLDHFKSVNDTHGHFAGDAVLCEAGRRMYSDLREYDSLGRYGGEEFLILLPGCDERATRSSAERIRGHLANHPMVLSDTTLKITASFGGTCVLPGVSCTAEELIRRADEALYRAKDNGRNRVEFLGVDEAESVEPNVVSRGAV
ncbi:MAG TPA: diguanylate cyclase [Bryobacteraceae bacterium]|nr:diguanylate cyclase [Bryobacteraceae bacterium]